MMPRKKERMSMPVTVVNTFETIASDMICANSLKSAGAGFGTDTNIVTLITKNSEESLELMSKEQVAHKILDKLLAIVQP